MGVNFLQYEGLLYSFVVSLNNYWQNLLILFILVLMSNNVFKKQFGVILVLGWGVVTIWEVPTIPSSLQVGYNNIHPFVFYFTLLFLLSFFGHDRVVTLRRIYILVYGGTALLLGSYWGLGNSIWGALWVNDIIEWNLAIVIALLLYDFHTKGSWRYTFLIILFVIFSLELIRNGIIFSRHSFFDRTNVTNSGKLFFISYGVGAFFRLIILYGTQASVTYTGVVFYTYWVFKTFTNAKTPLTLFHILSFLLFFVWFKYSPHYYTERSFVQEKILNVVQFTAELKTQLVFLKEKVSVRPLLINFAVVYMKKTNLSTSLMLEYGSTILVGVCIATVYLLCRLWI